MAAETNKTHEISVCSVEVAPGEVDAGANMTLSGRVSCTPAVDLRGQTLLIKDQDGALAGRLEFAEFDGATNETRELVMKAPARAGAYTWVAVCPAYEKAGISNEETSAPFSFTVRPHSTRVVVWDTPSAIECGETFSVKLGVKCSSQCRPDGWALEVRDHDGDKQAAATLSDEPWPGTDALYFAEMDLTAPDTEGRYTWEAKAPATDLDVPHTECIVSFGVTVVAAPECLLTVEAVDLESQTPVKGAKVVVHPFRAFTDDRGVAEVRIPKGAYRLFVSGRNYFPFSSDGDAKSDVTIRAELAFDEGPSDADLWA